MFYKNALLVLPQFFFAFLSLSSGQNFYYDILYQSYNVFFTGFPIIALGVLDQASRKEIKRQFPARPKGFDHSFFCLPLFV